MPLVFTVLAKMPVPLTPRNRKNLSPMDARQKETLTRHIQQTIAGLKADIDAYKGLTQPIAPDDSIGRLTRMEAINSKSINEAALRKARNKLTRLERTLRNACSRRDNLLRALSKAASLMLLLLMASLRVSRPIASSGAMGWVSPL